jgi:hypothetical protein
MVQGMDIDMIVPQHGRPIQGKAGVQRFIDWIRQLECGADLLIGPGRFREGLRLVADNTPRVPRPQVPSVPRSNPFEGVG